MKEKIPRGNRPPATAREPIFIDAHGLTAEEKSKAVKPVPGGETAGHMRAGEHQWNMGQSQGDNYKGYEGYIELNEEDKEKLIQETPKEEYSFPTVREVPNKVKTEVGGLQLPNNPQAAVALLQRVMQGKSPTEREAISKQIAEIRKKGG